MPRIYGWHTLMNGHCLRLIPNDLFEGLHLLFHQLIVHQIPNDESSGEESPTDKIAKRIVENELSLKMRMTFLSWNFQSALKNRK